MREAFSANRGDVVLPVKTDPLPTLSAGQIPKAPVPPGGRAGAAGGGPTGPFDSIYATASRENGTGDVILKIVTEQAAPQPLKIELQGAPRIAKEARGGVLSAEPAGINSLAEPTQAAPRAITIADAGIRLAHKFPAESVSVIRPKKR